MTSRVKSHELVVQIIYPSGFICDVTINSFLDGETLLKEISMSEIYYLKGLVYSVEQSVAIYLDKVELIIIQERN